MATPTTLHLLGLRGKTGAIPCSYQNPFHLGSLRIEMIPSGHLPGSAQIAIDVEDTRILYTSDIYDQQQHFADSMVATPCDVMILDATYGTPRHRFPSRTEVARQLREEVAHVLADDGTPLVLVEGSLGRAQEILKELSLGGHKLVVSRSIFRWNRRYREMGLQAADCRSYAGRPERGSVLVYPMRSRGLSGLSRIRNLCKIACSGQGDDLATCRRLGVDRVVPLVDHIDFEGLVRLVESCRPKRTLTVFSYAETLAQELRARGFDAQPLAETPQLEFDF